MEKWKTRLKGDPTGWLLEEENPSVRYFTLLDLPDRPPQSAEVKQARLKIGQIGAVPAILSHQSPGGFWGISENFYEHSKYKGTVWQLIVLAELGADGEEERVHGACEFILNHSQDRESGGFATQSDPQGGGDHNLVIPCLSGNMVFSLIRMGYLNDPRLQRAVDWITTYQRFDDKTGPAPKGWPYEIFSCFGRHSCSMGAIKALKALAEIPESLRSAKVKDTLARGAEYFLLHHVYKRSHNLEKVCKSGWLNFGFPLMYQTDALEILGVLTRLGYRDQRMQEALDLVLDKQDDQGRWRLENTFNGRFLVNIETKNTPSKWVTLNALRVIKAWG